MSPRGEAQGSRPLAAPCDVDAQGHVPLPRRVLLTRRRYYCRALPRVVDLSLLLMTALVASTYRRGGTYLLVLHKQSYSD